MSGPVPAAGPGTIGAVATILLARHGESDWNAERRWQGHADRPLTERGRSQAAVLAERLTSIRLNAVYASDLRRAVDTAAAVAARQGVVVRTLAELREVDVGSWSGLTRAEAEARFPDGFRRWLDGGPGWDDGETYAAMSERVVGAVRRIATVHEDRPVLVVCHGGPIRALHAAALGLDVDAYRRIRPVEPNASLSAVRVENGAFSELRAAAEIADVLARDRRARLDAVAQPPSPAG
jgi:broad specificity phosphatase PhoE